MDAGGTFGAKSGTGTTKGFEGGFGTSETVCFGSQHPTTCGNGTIGITRGFLTSGTITDAGVVEVDSTRLYSIVGTD